MISVEQMSPFKTYLTGKVQRLPCVSHRYWCSKHGLESQLHCLNFQHQYKCHTCHWSVHTKGLLCCLFMLIMVLYQHAQYVIIARNLACEKCWVSIKPTFFKPFVSSPSVIIQFFLFQMTVYAPAVHSYSFCIFMPTNLTPILVSINLSQC